MPRALMAEPPRPATHRLSTMLLSCWKNSATPMGIASATTPFLWSPNRVLVPAVSSSMRGRLPRTVIRMFEREAPMGQQCRIPRPADHVTVFRLCMMTPRMAAST